MTYTVKVDGGLILTIVIQSEADDDAFHSLVQQHGWEIIDSE